MKKGFTLIEMMIVTAVVAILAAIAVPTYRQYIERTENVAARTLLQHIALAEIAKSTDMMIASAGGGGYIYVVPPTGVAGVNALAQYGFRPNVRVAFTVLPAAPGRPAGFVAFAATSVEGAQVFAYDSQYLAIASPMDAALVTLLGAALPAQLTRYDWNAAGATVHSTINIDTTTYKVTR